MITLKYKSEPELFKLIAALDNLLKEDKKISVFLWKDVPLFYIKDQLVSKKFNYINNRIIINKEEGFIIQLSDNTQLIKRDIVDNNNYRMIIHELILNDGFKDDVEMKIVDNKLVEIDGFNLIKLFKDALTETIKCKWN